MHEEHENVWIIHNPWRTWKCMNNTQSKFRQVQIPAKFNENTLSPLNSQNWNSVQMSSIWSWSRKGGRMLQQTEIPQRIWFWTWLANWKLGRKFLLMQLNPQVSYLTWRGAPLNKAQSLAWYCSLACFSSKRYTWFCSACNFSIWRRQQLPTSSQSTTFNTHLCIRSWKAEGLECFFTNRQNITGKDLNCH